MKVITLDHHSFKRKCAELQSKLDFQPDLVVGILKGGGYVVSHFEAETLILLKLQRTNNYLKKSLFVGCLLKFLPYVFTDKLRILESNRAKRSIRNLNKDRLKLEKLTFHVSSKQNIKKILIVDDAIDTGRTMYIVKNNLEQLFPGSSVKSAVISWTIESSVVSPDYYLYKSILVRFPWSKDYRGKDFEEESYSC
ncbi:hypothetical protein JJL45_07550 [Tamlana sp. s12]|uniref:phosphoribosyltransferase n=1 Tax=Tamlana sp. s12 TaxID=1630406 RepID=UPI000838D6D0|nr:phosphoribosyltransferase family protein [Tamlana sp. s12]QQY83827.1 hypothetical protein JJL45_07550 [Tamlana sp. s12]